MYLLKLPDEPDELLSSVFTFHYVSIKTRTPAAQQHRHNKFTFHYVSIKTQHLLNLRVTLTKFTFHYVSIKTGLLP